MNLNGLWKINLCFESSDQLSYVNSFCIRKRWHEVVKRSCKVLTVNFHFKMSLTLLARFCKIGKQSSIEQTANTTVTMISSSFWHYLPSSLMINILALWSSSQKPQLCFHGTAWQTLQKPTLMKKLPQDQLGQVSRIYQSFTINYFKLLLFWTVSLPLRVWNRVQLFIQNQPNNLGTILHTLTSSMGLQCVQRSTDIQPSARIVCP